MTLGNYIRHCKSLHIDVERTLKYIFEQNKNYFNYEAVFARSTEYERSEYTDKTPN